MHTKGLFNANQFDLGEVSQRSPTSNGLFMLTWFMFPPKSPKILHFLHQVSFSLLTDGTQPFWQGTIMLWLSVPTTIAIKPMGHEVCNAAEWRVISTEQTQHPHVLIVKKDTHFSRSWSAETTDQDVKVSISRWDDVDVALFAAYISFTFWIPGVLWVKELF